ncbi:MAG TPA: alpha-galactosidase [Chitinophagaceae bacterium]|nr:alpha-galactosidase [Chitinophagaceae bacterium]
MAYTSLAALKKRSKRLLPLIAALILSNTPVFSQTSFDDLPVFNQPVDQPLKYDWLLEQGNFTTGIYRSKDHQDLIITNGLVNRAFRLDPYFGCYSFKNLETGKEMLRGIRPEAVVTINGKKYHIGGVRGQFEYAYLKDDWLKRFTRDTSAFKFTSFQIQEIKSRFTWKPRRWSTNKTWPPKGKETIFHFSPPQGELPGVTVDVHYEMYDNIPLMSKWITIQNKSMHDIRVDSFRSELLSMVENGNATGADGHLQPPHIFIKSNYSFGGMDAHAADHTTYWMRDSQYVTQVNYNYQTPCLLVSKPPIGPWYKLSPHKTFESFHTYELMYDSYDKERCGLAERKMYRILAPWVTENPMFLHLTTTNPVKVKAAIDQCSQVGFEMVILSFGSGLNMEDTSDVNIAKYKTLVDYAHSKGIELGGYSLFSSRHIDAANDVINPKTGKPGGAIFGNAPCLGSEWGLDYIKKLKTFITKTGFDILENDGPYPGDICASTTHPGHEGLLDSQWKQWWDEVSFYQWLRERGVYLNAPDWYFLGGSNKVAMGYRETNWSLPRAQQIIIERQNIYDGTWQKTPSMGWMFVPLVQYHGGGAAATIEPLHEHLAAYKTHLIQNFGSGVQACYRGPRLYDTPETEAMVKGVVQWYKKYRDILNSDIIHLRRADGRDWDGILHVNPKLKEKGLAMLYNPLDTAIKRTINLPLYYTGLTAVASISVKGGKPKAYKLNRDYSVDMEVEIPPQGYTWLVVK